MLTKDAAIIARTKHTDDVYNCIL